MQKKKIYNNNNYDKARFFHVLKYCGLTPQKMNNYNSCKKIFVINNYEIIYKKMYIFAKKNYLETFFYYYYYYYRCVHPHAHLFKKVRKNKNM